MNDALMCNTSACIICLHYGGKAQYALWLTGDQPEYLLMHEGRLLLADSREALLQLVPEHVTLMEVESVTHYHLDDVMVMIRSARPARVPDKAWFSTILNAWNMMEDIARTLGYTLPPYAATRRKAVDWAYYLLFCGADVLDDLSAEDRQTLPWRRRDHVVTRDYLTRAWARLRSHLALGSDRAALRRLRPRSHAGLDASEVHPVSMPVSYPAQEENTSWSFMAALTLPCNPWSLRLPGRMGCSWGACRSRRPFTAS